MCNHRCENAKSTTEILVNLSFTFSPCEKLLAACFIFIVFACETQTESVAPRLLHHFEGVNESYGKLWIVMEGAGRGWLYH